MMTAMPNEPVTAVRGAFSIEDPWRTPAQASVVRLRRSTDGEAPRLATTVSLYFDDEFLTFVFSAADDHIVATYSAHDEPLYEEDVVEVFLAPDDAAHYFEVEVNPKGATFDARIFSPEASRETMSVDQNWRSGAIAAVRKIFELDGTMTVDTLLRVPFASLGRSVPLPGERWQANFFRIDRHPSLGDEYSAWRPTLRVPADFHVPAAFGSVEFAP